MRGRNDREGGRSIDMISSDLSGDIKHYTLTYTHTHTHTKNTHTHTQTRPIQTGHTHPQTRR